MWSMKKNTKTEKMAMSETWEQTKARLKKQGINLNTEIVVIAQQEIKVVKPPEKLYNIHKRSLPVGFDKIVVYSVNKEDAEWWLEHRLKTIFYEDKETEERTVYYFDVIPVEATDREKGVYFNPKPNVIEEI